MNLEQREINIHGGCEEAAELMAGISILSDVQELIETIEGKGFYLDQKKEAANRAINHAKHHLIKAYSIIHDKNKLPGQLFVSGAIPPGHEEKGG